MIPDLDSQIGITIYSTQFTGIGGKIRSESKDFQVTELISEKIQNSISDQNGYAVYSLKKKKIDTNHAISGIFRTKGHSPEVPWTKRRIGHNRAVCLLWK